MTPTRAAVLIYLDWLASDKPDAVAERTRTHADAEELRAIATELGGGGGAEAPVDPSPAPEPDRQVGGSAEMGAPLVARLVLANGSPAPVDAYPYTLARTVRGAHPFVVGDAEDVRAELVRLHRASIDDVADNGDGTWTCMFPPGREPARGATDLEVLS